MPDTAEHADLRSELTDLVGQALVRGVTTHTIVDWVRSVDAPVSFFRGEAKSPEARQYTFVVEVVAVGTTETIDLATDAGWKTFAGEVLQSETEALEIAQELTDDPDAEIVLNNSDPKFYTRISRVADSPVRYTSIEMLYTDADNWKTTAPLVVRGLVDDATRAAVIEHLIDGRWFCPPDVGIEHPLFSHGEWAKTSADGPLVELDWEQVNVTANPPSYEVPQYNTVDFADAAAMIEAFCSAAEKGWPNRNHSTWEH